MKTSWSLTDEIYRFRTVREEVPFTLANACEGIICFGSIGSGKPSGPGTHLPLAMLADGWGMLVLCAKMDEAERVKALAKKAARENDIIEFGPHNPQHRYNFLDALLKGGALSVVQGMGQVRESIIGKVSDNEWKQSADEHLLRGVEAYQLTGKPLQMPELSQFLNSLEKQESFFRSVGGPINTSDQDDFETCKDYFLNQWAERGDKTRASVLMSLNPALSPFCTGQMRKLFCSDTTCSPEDLRAGKIIIVNIPALGDADILGRAAGTVWKYMAQRKLQKFFGKEGMKKSDDSTRPVVIMADEAHYYATSYDEKFQSTARASRAITFYLTQSINAFYNALGGGFDAKTKVQGLLDNIQGVRILCQNGSAETYDWFMKVLGKELQERTGQSASFHGEGGGGASISIQRDVLLDSRDFQIMAKGGKPFKKVVTAIIQSAGKIYNGNKLWTVAAFPQIDL